MTLKRNEKQPLEYASAGSTFKKTRGIFCRKAYTRMLDFKGLNVGDAEVSEKHSGFIINKGNASAEQVLELIGISSKSVFENFQ